MSLTSPIKMRSSKPGQPSRRSKRKQDVVLVPALLALVAVQQGEPAMAIAIAVGAILMVTVGLEGMATATSLAIAQLEELEEAEQEAASAAGAASRAAETRLGLAAMEERR